MAAGPDPTDSPEEPDGSEIAPREIRPLVSAALEYQLLGSASLVAGFGFVVVSVFMGPIIPNVIRFVLVALFFGLALYFFGYRQITGMVVENAPEPATTAREDARSTRTRVGAITLIQVVALIAITLLLRTATIGAGILLGNGIVLLWTSAALYRWIEKSGCRLLREPRWRFGATIDYADFYVEQPLHPPRP